MFSLESVFRALASDIQTYWFRLIIEYISRYLGPDMKGGLKDGGPGENIVLTCGCPQLNHDSKAIWKPF